MTGRPGPAAAPPAARRRVLIITYDFPPSRMVAAEICAQIARYLPRYGWEPVVLTVREDYFPGGDLPAARLFPGAVIRTRVIPHPFAIYRRVKTRLRPKAEPGNGALGAHTSSGQMGAFRRWTLSLLRVPDEYTGWILPAVAAGMRAVHRHGIEHLFSFGGHSTGHLIGLVLARLSGLPWTAHFLDPWTYPWNQWQVAPISALSAWVERGLERMVLRHADVVALVTEQHTNWLRTGHPDLPADKFVTIPNGFDGAEWEGLEGERGEVRNEKFVITYAGSLYFRRSPLPLFRALQTLIDSGAVVRERVQVDLIGQCDVAAGVRVTEMAETCGLAACVRVTGLLGRAETLRRVARSDLLLLLAEGWTLQIPQKTYEYLRAGRPILALTSEGAVVDLLRRTGGAWVVDPADEAAVTAAVREAYRLWRDGREGPRADRDMVARFDRSVLVGQFAKAFETAAVSP